MIVRTAMENSSANEWNEPGAMTFAAWHIWNLAADAAQRAKDVRRQRPDGFTPDTVASVILAVAAAETFVNETGDAARHRPSPWGDGSPWQELRDVSAAREYKRAGLVSKYKLVSAQLAGTSLADDVEPLLSFSRLMQLRNSWIHAHAQAEPSEIFQWFIDQKWTYNRREDYPKVGGWLFQLETPQVATWACRSAHNVVWHVVEQIAATGENDADRRLFSCQWEKTRTDRRSAMP